MRSSNHPNQKELMQQLMNNQRNTDPSPKPKQSLAPVDRVWNHHHRQAPQRNVRPLLENTVPDTTNHKTIEALQDQVKLTQKELKLNDNSQDPELRSQFYSLLVLLNEVKDTKYPDQDLLTEIQTANKKADDEKRQALHQIAQQFLINKATITIKGSGQSLQEFIKDGNKAKGIGIQYDNGIIHQFSHKGKNQLQTDNIPPPPLERRHGARDKPVPESLLCVGNKLILSGISIKGSRGNEERLETLCLLLYKKKLAELQNSTGDTRYIAEGTPLPIIKLKNVSPPSCKEHVIEHLLTCYFKKVSIGGVTYGLNAEGGVTDIEKLKDVSGSFFRTPSM